MDSCSNFSPDEKIINLSHANLDHLQIRNPILDSVKKVLGEENVGK